MNLFIAYDLRQPGRDYRGLHAAIHDLGPHYRFQDSLYYVKSTLPAKAAYERLRSAMDQNDLLAVIEADGAVVTTWDQRTIAAINAAWPLPHLQ